MSLLTGSKSRMYIRGLGVVFLIAALFFAVYGTALTQYTTQAQSVFKLAFACPGGSTSDQYAGSSPDISQCTTPIAGQTGTAPTQQYPNNGWQLMWGTVKFSNGVDASSGFVWSQFWYNTYRFDTGNTPLSWYDDYGTGTIQPACGTEDFNGDHSACNQANLGTGAQSWFGYTATRTMQFPIDTTATINLSTDDGVRLTIAGNAAGGQGPSTPIYTWIGKSGYTRPATATYTFKANVPYLVKLEWFQYTGNALIGNQWQFQNVQTCNFSAGNAVNILLMDQSHGSQNANDITGTYTVDPTFKVHVDILQAGCTFTDVPVVLVPWQDSFASSPPRSPITDHLSQLSSTAWEKPFSLQPGKYFLNIGFVFSTGTAWGLSVFQLSFNAPNSAVTVQPPSQQNPFLTGNIFMIPAIILAVAGSFLIFGTIKRRPSGT